MTQSIAKDSTMKIGFPQEEPVFDGASLVMRFVVEMDGEPVACAITAEALEDHFGAPSALEGALREAFARGQARIHAVCARAIEETGGPVVLHSGRFRTAEG